MGQKAAVILEQDIGTRVSLLEVGQREIVHTLGQMREDAKNERREIADAFESLRRDLGSRARPFPFKEVGAAVGLTLAVATTFVTALNWWADAKNAVMTQQVAALTQTLDPGEIAVLKYRLQKLEAATSYASK